MATVPTVKGGDYEAVRAKDGTWTILDVPIFAECERSFKLPNGKTITARFDRDWQEKAVRRAQEKHAASGVMRAIYPRHKHDPKDDRDTLGFFLPKDVREVELRGGKRAVTFADYVGVPDSVYAELKSRKHPYKSVELPIGADPEFTGLAWLKEPPFHDDFALQTIGKEISESETREGVVGFASDVGLSAHALVRFGMADVEKKPAAGSPPAGAPAAGAPAAPVAPGAPAPGEAAAATDAKVPTADPAAHENAEAEQGKASMTMLSALMAQVSVLTDLVKRLAGGVQTDATGAARPPAIQAAFDASGAPTAEFAAMTAENAALKAEVEGFKKAEAKRTTVEKAVAALSGYAIGDAMQVVTAQFDAGGAVAVDAFVKGIALVGKKDPPADWGKDTGKAPIASDPLLAKFPESAEAIAAFSAVFDTIPAVARGALTRERYIELELERSGLTQTEKK